jgi:hypothetical protein
MSFAMSETVASDPHGVDEVVCDGPVDIHWIGNRGTITFTHPRAKSEPLFARGEMHIDLVVRARIAASVENLIGLRDLLAQLCPTDKSPNDIPTGAGATGKLY